MKKLYCFIYSKYKKFENPKTSYLFKKKKNNTSSFYYL